jgi:hypothetical protein
MSKVRQKQVYDGANDITHYEITFTALAHDWIDAQTYEEISEHIDLKINQPEAYQLQTAYDALTFMMDTWRMNRHIASDEWKYGFRAAWMAAGGNENDLTTK